MRSLRLLPLALGALLAAWLGACDGSDAVSLRIRLHADLSGEVTASMLTMPEEPNELEQASTGIAWGDRARLVFSTGKFTDIGEVQIGDLTMRGEVAEDGISHVRVTLPRGEGTRWHKLFTTDDVKRRERMAKAIDPEGGIARVGSTIKIVIETPSPVTSTGVRSNARGLKAEHEKLIASLLVPLDAVVDGEGTIEWHVIW